MCSCRCRCRCRALPHSLPYALPLLLLCRAAPLASCLPLLPLLRFIKACNKSTFVSVSNSSTSALLLCAALLSSPALLQLRFEVVCVSQTPATTCSNNNVAQAAFLVSLVVVVCLGLGLGLCLRLRRCLQSAFAAFASHFAFACAAAAFVCAAASASASHSLPSS